MSGHSKWSSIKHKKGAADAKRGQLFSKLSRAIIVSAKEGGPDPESNAALATAIQKARDNSMPKDNIERAIQRGAGGAEGEAYESMLYEGYAPGGVAVICTILTDNRNRTASDLRFIFTKNGGSLGTPGSVAWQFDRKGLVLVEREGVDEDTLMEVALNGGELYPPNIVPGAGADSTLVQFVSGKGELIMPPENLHNWWSARSASRI